TLKRVRTLLTISISQNWTFNPRLLTFFLLGTERCYHELGTLNPFSTDKVLLHRGRRVHCHSAHVAARELGDRFRQCPLGRSDVQHVSVVKRLDDRVTDNSLQFTEGGDTGADVIVEVTAVLVVFLDEVGNRFDIQHWLKRLTTRCALEPQGNVAEESCECSTVEIFANAPALSD